MKNTFYKFLLIAFLILVISGLSATAGIIVYRQLFVKPEAEAQITSHTIVEKIADKGVLVTKSIYTAESIELKANQDTGWSKFWWGKTIEAEGFVQVDIGSDLSMIQDKDIEIDQDNKIIKISLPEPTISSTTIQGDITVETKEGIIERFKDTYNEDYNLAVSEIKSQAEDTVKSQEDIYQEAEEQTVNILNLLVQDTGYRFEVINQ
jgi:hypothetical protein